MTEENQIEEEYEDATIEIGQPAPEFTANAFHQGQFKKINLEDYKGKWVVLFFYPADFTFICPTELASLADNYETLKALNVEVLSISTDTEFSHKAWHDSSQSIKKVNFPMVADPTHEISSAYKVLIEEKGITHRGTFIINPEGKLKAYEVHHDHIGRSIPELIRKIKAAQHTEKNPGQVCPVNWQEGDRTVSQSMENIGRI